MFNLSKICRNLKGQRNGASAPPASALDALQATLLLTKHLDALLPFLLALRRVPPEALLARVGLVQGLARDIAGEAGFARDWYAALELLTGEDLGARSVAELIELSVAQLSGERMGDLWTTAYQIGLLDEETVRRWVMFGGLTGGTGKEKTQRPQRPRGTG